jgi:hypothetical protein
LTGWLAAAGRRPSAIAGRGWFPVAALAEGAEVWRGDPAVVPLNHSCDPNTWWARNVVVTRREIGEDEELTIDYSTLSADPSLLLVCHCESYRCRQMVTGDDWRIPQLHRRYAGHWAPELERLINEVSR